jgi:hypothetical protein
VLSDSEAMKLRDTVSRVGYHACVWHSLEYLERFYPGIRKRFWRIIRPIIGPKAGPLKPTKCAHEFPLQDKYIKRRGMLCNQVALAVKTRLKWERALDCQLPVGFCYAHTMQRIGRNPAQDAHNSPRCGVVKYGRPPCRRPRMKHPDKPGQYLGTCAKHGAKGYWKQKLDGDAKTRRNRARNAWKAAQWDARGVEPSASRSPLEERAVRARKPLRPLY